MNRETILVVDDDEDVLGLIEKHLSHRGYEVITAYDGEQALRLLERVRFDLVITDLKMPRMDGMEVLRRVKAAYPDTEVIILTGHGTMDSAIEALRDGGAFDYLQKPLYNIKQLSFVAKKALERKRLREENRKLLTTLQERQRHLEEKLARVRKDLEGLARLVTQSTDPDLRGKIRSTIEGIIEIIRYP